MDANGFVSFIAIHLNIIFSLKESTIYMEHEINNLDVLLVSFTLCGNLKFADNGSVVWELDPSKYMIYELTGSQMGISIELHTPPWLSTWTLSIVFVVIVKIEPSVHTLVDLSESFDEDVPTQFKPSPLP